MTLEQQPNLPVTPEALARDAAACEAAGASIYHLHVRDAAGMPTMEPAMFAEALDAVRSSSDLIVQFTTGGAVGDPDDARIAPLDLGPEMATLTTGSVNFGDDVFLNPPALIGALYDRMRTRGVLPEFEIFDAGMLANALRLTEGADHHLHFDLVLGVPGAMPAWPDAIRFLTGHLPEGCTWTATGIGRNWLDVAGAAIEAGGGVRTGFEDVLYVGRGQKAASNAQLVEIVVGEAAQQGRTPASPAETRNVLGLA